MARFKIKAVFRQRLSEKLMDLGNIVAAALVFGQFVSGKEFSIGLFGLGTILAISCYIGSYIISS